MAKRTRPEDDILWKMLRSELQMAEVRELQTYLDGDADHYDMGYGDLSIEPYDARGGNSRMFRIRHATLGETTISHSALKSMLHDLAHHYRRNSEL